MYKYDYVIIMYVKHCMSIAFSMHQMQIDTDTNIFRKIYKLLQTIWYGLYIKHRS